MKSVQRMTLKNMSDAVKNCSTCIYFNTVEEAAEGEPDHGECRLKAPIYDGRIYGVWPQSISTDWCGEGVFKETKEV